MDFSPRYFGPFFLINQIGKGGTAEVFLGILTENFEEASPKKSMYAIKRLLPELSREKNFIQCLTSEAKLASILAHPNIVSVSDLGNVGTDYYISMEWINGKSLFDLLKTVKVRKKAISSHYLLYICYEVAKGLNYAHQAKDVAGRPMDIVHCDISPHNILISYSGKVKLSDFGIATAAKQQEQIEGETVFGKIHYIAPEQIAQKGFDYRADIYSFGVLLYESLAFRKPFRAKSPIELQHLIRNVAPSFDYPVFEKYPEITSFIQACLEKDPTNRPKSLDIFMDLYKKISTTQQVDQKKISRLMQHLMKDIIADEKKDLKARLKDFVQIQNAKEESPIEDPHSNNDVVEPTEVLRKDLVNHETKVVLKSEAKEGVAKLQLKKKAVIKVIPKTPVVEEHSLPPSDPPLDPQGPIDGVIDQKIFDVEGESLSEDDLPHTVKMKSPPSEDEAEEETIVSEVKHKPVDPHLPNSPQETNSFKMFDTKPESQTTEILEESIPEYLVERPGATVEAVLYTDPNFPKEQISEGEILIQNKKVSFSRPKDYYEDLKPVTAIEEDTISIQIPKSWIKFGLVLIAISILGYFGFQKGKDFAWSAKTVAIKEIDIFISYETKDQRMFKTDVKELSHGWVEEFLLAPSVEFLQNQYKLYNPDQDLDLKIRLARIEESPPFTTDESLFKTKVGYQHLFGLFQVPEKTNQESSARLFVHLFHISGEHRRYPFQYSGSSPIAQHLAFMPVNQGIKEAQVMLVHQILRLKGAPILTNAKGQPIFPQGYAEPDQKPLHPQPFGEIMTLMIPQSPTQSYLLDDLVFAKIGPHTAQKLKWVQ